MKIERVLHILLSGFEMFLSITVSSLRNRLKFSIDKALPVLENYQNTRDAFYLHIVEYLIFIIFLLFFFGGVGF